MSDVSINGITYPEPQWVELPGKDGKPVRFDIPKPPEKVLNGVSTNPPETRAVFEADEAIRQMIASPYNTGEAVADMTALEAIQAPAVNEAHYVISENCRYGWTGTKWTQVSMDESKYTDELNALSSAIGEVTEDTRNLWPHGDVMIRSAAGWGVKWFDPPLPAGTYTLSAEVSSTHSGSTCYFGFYKGSTQSSSTKLVSVNLPKTARTGLSVTLEEACTAVLLSAGTTASNGAGSTADFVGIQIETGASLTPYIPHRSAVDAVARQSVPDRSDGPRIAALDDEAAPACRLVKNGGDLYLESVSGTGIGALDDYCIGTRSLRDIFEHGNVFRYGDFESGYPLSDMIAGSNGTPAVTDEDAYSGGHCLKCFGGVSTQIALNPGNDQDRRFYAACMVKVVRFQSGGGAGVQYSTAPGSLRTSVSDAWTLQSVLFTRPSGATGKIYFGTVSAANMDAYIDNAVVVDCSIFAGGAPDKDTLDQAYLQYVTALQQASTERFSLTQQPQVYDGVLVGAVLGAAGAAQRFLAMRQLFDIANKKIVDPGYEPKAAEFTYATKGAVLKMPNAQPGMLQNFDFKPLFAQNADVSDIPASTTKVVSLITGLDYIDNVKDMVTIKSSDVQTGSGNFFAAGDMMTIEDLICGMMLPSSNTCAAAFARIAGGKILQKSDPDGEYTDQQCLDAFVAEMAVKADSIGMTDSEFVVPSGLSADNSTTAMDMIRATVEACSYNQILKVWGKKSHTIHVKGQNQRDVVLETTVTNQELEADYAILGGKTGSLDASGSTHVDAKALVMIAMNKA